MILNVLFVDDETRILDAFRRQLRPMRKEWKVWCADSGDKALSLLRDNQIDVVISDMRMPGMDGATLLEYVAAKYPRTVRIVLSGHSDGQMASRAVRSAHQFLSKPCSFDHLKSTINQAIVLRDLLKNERLQELVSGTSLLPSLPDLYNQLVAELRTEAPSLDRVGKIVERDVSMAARILQLVNSPYFGLRFEIRNIQHAVNYLGVNTLKNMVLLIHVFSSCSGDAGLLRDFCDHSMLVATLARQITLISGAELEEAEQAFTAGLLHDVGWLVLFNSGRLQHSGKHNEQSLIQAEQNLWESCHAEIGAYLLGIWGIPSEIVRIVAYHHRPSAAPFQSLSLAAVHVAEVFEMKDDSLLDRAMLKKLDLEDRIEDWHHLYLATTKGV